MKHKHGYKKVTAMVVLLIVVNIFLPVAEAQSIRAASNEKRPVSGMVSSLIGGIMNLFSDKV